MAVESVTFITDFNTSNPVGATDTVSTLDDHIRNMKIGISGSFANFTGIAMTSTEAELNTLDGFTGVVADFNIIAGGAAAGVTATEFQYLNGVTGAIQTQLNARLAAANNLSDVASAATSRTNLGVAIGSDVQAYDANLDQIAALAVTDSNFIVGNGSVWVAETGAAARTSLGLGALAILSEVTPAVMGGLATGTVTILNDPEVSTETTTGGYTLMKEIYCPADGEVTIGFDLRSQFVTNDTATARIYINDVAQGTVRSEVNQTYVTQANENFTVTNGDLLQIYGYVSTGSGTCYVQNFNIQAASGHQFSVQTV